MKIYVVRGTTGEYSDRSEWSVVAFRTEERARERVLAATARAKEIEVTRVSRYAAVKDINEFDLDMEMDYTGTNYYYNEVELED